MIDESTKKDKPVNPTITKDEFESLGFTQYHFHPFEGGGTWSVYYFKRLDPPADYSDILRIEWFCGTQRYRIYRDTKHLKNIPGFEGFLRHKKDLKFILSRLDLSIFYKS